MRVLVDTSVWVDFLRGDTIGLRLGSMLREDQVLTHGAVIGELALGNLGDEGRRARVLEDLGLLPKAEAASEGEVLGLIQGERLWASGVGWVDAQLLASARLSGARLWTNDRRLRGVAERLGVVFAGG